MRLAVVIGDVGLLDSLPHVLQVAQPLQDLRRVPSICQRPVFRSLEIDLHRAQCIGQVHLAGKSIHSLMQSLQVHPVGVEHIVQRLFLEVCLVQNYVLIGIAPCIKPAATV